MGRGLFIAGTDTDAGKTVVCSALLDALRRSGIDAVPMKPVQSGCDEVDGELVPVDLEYALSMSGYEPDNEERGLMCSYAFKPACSPHLAAAGEVAIDLDVIEKAYKTLSSKHELVLCEGAGGLMVPLHGEIMMLDLMKRLALPVVLVARAGLGTINHSLLSLKVIRDAGLDVAAIIFTETVAGGPAYIKEDNLKTIGSIGNVPVLGCLPYLDGIGSDPESFQKIRDAWQESMNAGLIAEL